MRSFGLNVGLMILLLCTVALLAGIFLMAIQMVGEAKLTPETIAKKFREMLGWPRRFWKSFNEKDPPKPTSAVGGE